MKDGDRFYLVRAAKGNLRVRMVVPAETKESLLKELEYLLNPSWRVVETRLVEKEARQESEIFRLDKAVEQLQADKELMYRDLEDLRRRAIFCVFCGEVFDSDASLKDHVSICADHPADKTILGLKAVIREALVFLKGASKPFWKFPFVAKRAIVGAIQELQKAEK